MSLTIQPGPVIPDANLVGYTFWSFHLKPGSVIAESDVPPGTQWLAEVIFAYPACALVGEGIASAKPFPVSNVPSPLNLSNIVGATGACTGVRACNGVTSYAEDSGVIQQTPAMLSTALSTAQLTVSAGTATLTTLELVFLSGTSIEPTKAMTLATPNLGNVLSFGPSYQCAGQWELKANWARFGNKSNPYSISNPPLPLPLFPPGAEFLDSLLSEGWA